MFRDTRHLNATILVAVAAISGFLLFQLQPLVSRVILPWFGGSPAVWTTCMLFFQVLLLAGYAYADRLTQLPSPRLQMFLHTAALLMCLPLLPIGPTAVWKPDDGTLPTLRIIGLLAATVGLPYFVLASTGPLVGVWWGRLAGSSSPLRLYAASNVGSLCGLLAYPFVVERTLDVPSQMVLWSWLFGIFAIASALTGWYSARQGRHRGSGTAVSAAAEASDHSCGNDHPSDALRIRMAWILLPALASAAFLAVTNHLCRDVTVVPFLWVGPFTVYLASFIICFDHGGWYRRPAWPLLAIAISVLVFATLLAGRLDQVATWLPLQLRPVAVLRRPTIETAIHLGWLFTACMLLHGELVRVAPSAKRLTRFYLAIAAGGALGGCVVAIVCPLIFTTYWEYHLLLGLVGAIAFMVVGGATHGVSTIRKSRLLAVAIGASTWAALWLWSMSTTFEPNSIYRARNFYGVLTIKEHNRGDPNVRGLGLYHGRILHGYQFLEPSRRREPTTYYGPESLPDIVMASLRTVRPTLRVGVVGLGAGTLAAYGRAGDFFKFYEIDPLVIGAQGRFFHFLEDCPAETLIEEGDARICLEREDPQAFDALFIDAFSGDAVPAHLLTREALTLYRRHLTPNGFVAFHITNQFLDLGAVVTGLAKDAGLQTFSVRSKVPNVLYQAQSEWMVILQNPVDANQSAAPSRAVLWTDQQSSLWEILR